MRERLALLAAGVLLLIGLTMPITSPDEVRHSEIPTEMAARGDWVVPHHHGRPYLDKPPLHYWIVGASYSLLGPRPALSRWPSVLSAVLCVGALYLFGRKLFDEKVARTAAVVLAVTPGFQVAAHYGNLDVLLTLWTTLCQLFLWLAMRRGDRVDYRWLIGSGLACGLGLLTKGPITVLIAVPPVLLWDWLRGYRLRLRAWAAFGAVAALVAGPWYVAVAWRQPEFLHYFFVRHHLARFAGTLEHQRPLWFFLPVLLVGMLPFSLLLPRLAATLFKVDATLRQRRTDTLGVALMAGAWPILFFSLSSGKLPAYILPSFPFLALLLAWHLHLPPPAPSRWRGTALLVLPALLGIVVIANPSRLAGPFPQPWGARTQAFWVVVWLATIAACWTLRVRRGAAATLAALLLSAELLLTALPALARTNSLFGRAANKAEVLADGGSLAIVLIAGESDSLLFMETYPLPILQLDPSDHRGLQTLLEDDGELILVSEPGHLAWLNDEPNYRLEMVAGRGHVFRLSRARDPLPTPAVPDATR